MLNPILTAMGINANSAQVIQGVLIAGVMMIGGLVTCRGRGRHEPANFSARAIHQRPRRRRPPALRAFVAENPTLDPGGGPCHPHSDHQGRLNPIICRSSGMRNTLLQAAPLGILAGAQTILMLSGGIDLRDDDCHRFGLRGGEPVAAWRGDCRFCGGWSLG